VIVDLLRAFGIDYVALNPGASYRGLHDSLVNYGGNKPEIILCTHEEIAVSIPHGYAKVTGRPKAAAADDVVGLLHATMTYYYALLDRAPVLVLGATGPAAIARAAEIPAHAERPGNLTAITGRHTEAVGELIGLAEETAAAVIVLSGRVSSPNRHSQNLTGGGALADANLVLAIDVGDLS